MLGWKWSNITAILVVLVMAYGVFYAAHRTTQAAKDGKEAHDYLCYQKSVVIPARIASTVKYASDIELGLRDPIPGITSADLANAVQRDQDNLRALSRVKCP